jgi:Legume lectin domain/FecR protein
LNYSGKFDAKISADGALPHSNAHVHVETVHAAHAPADAIIVQDAHLLFNAQFTRSGVDLVLSKDSQELVLPDYFKGEKRAPLSSPDGAHLSGDLVSALSGHVQYAQADGNAGLSKVIGHVSKLAGTATAIRNGVSVVLHNGDNVEKGDVVESGANSTLGITFIDGTVFGLLSNARMVLNEMVYDPNGSNNSSLLSLVAGTITFVAGETAKHGDMKVDTPVATMGIRGTAVLCEIDFTVPGQGTPDAKFQVLVEPDGTTGSYILFDKTTLTPLAVVDTAGTQINISNGIISQTSAPLSPELQRLINDVFSLKFSDNSNTRTLDHHTDTLIPLSLEPIKLASGVTAIPMILNLNNTGLNSSSSSQNGATIGNIHIDQAPTIAVSGDAALTVHTGASQATGVDSVSGTVRFTDINVGDLPFVSTKFTSFKLLDAQQNDITATLTPLQQAQIAAVEAQLSVIPTPGNNNNGSATWTYSVADSAFSFLTAGETLALTYNAIVDNNYLPNELTASQTFTISISGPSNVEWIHPTGGLWSTGSDWSSGAVPTASQDAIIPAQNIPGGSGLYDVTIEAPAFARNLTLNANNTTGAEVINDSTLTVGQMLTIFNNGVLNNAGTVTVGKLELFDQSLLQNSGLITLGQGGDFTESGIITNSGTIELAGGTLNVQADIDNSGGVINVDIATTLNLEGVAITGGTINDFFGAINVTADSSIKGDETDAVLNNGGVTVESGVTLTMDNVAANSTTFADLAGSSIRVDEGNSLGLNGSIINGGTINDFGTIVVSADSSINGTGTAAVLNGGQVMVESEATFKLDNVVINGAFFTEADSSSTIQIDAGTRLTLHGATFDGGTINDNATVDVVADSAIKGGETDAVLNSGGVTIESEVTLTMDDVTANGTVFTDVDASSTILVDAGASFMLNGVTINGGTIDDSGDIVVTADSSIDGADADAVLNNGVVTVESEVTLTLDNVTANTTTFNDLAGGTLQLDDGDALNLNGAIVNGGAITDNGTININGAVTFEGGVAVNGGAMSIAKMATLDIENPMTGIGASFNGVNVINSGTIQVDSAELGTTTITLFLGGGTAITGGALLIHVGFPVDSVEGAVEIGTGGASFNQLTVTNNNLLTIDGSDALALNSTTIDGGTLNILGELDSAGTSFITGTTISNLNNIVVSSGTLTIDPSPVTNTGTIQVTGDGTLVLNQEIITNTNGTVEADGIDPTHFSTLDLEGTAINGGTVDIFGLLASTGSSSINGAAITNTGTLDVTSGTLTVAAAPVFDNNNTLEANGAELDLVNTTVINDGTVEATGTGMLNLESATINGGSVLTATSTDVIEATSGISTISGASSFINNGTLETLGAELDLVNTTLTNNGSVVVDVTEGLSGTLKLENAAINGGSVLTATSTDVIEATSGVSTIGGASSFINSGALEALGAELDLINTVVTNAGTVEATGGGVLNLQNATINGGSVLTAASTDVIEATSGVSTISGASSFINNGTLETLGAELDLVNTTLTNNGSVVVDVTEGLSGTLKLENTAINGGSVTTAASTDMIEATSGVSTINGTASFVNAGTVAANGAELDLVNTTVSNAGGTIESIGTGILNLRNAAINGGFLGGSGRIATAAGNFDSTLNGITIAAGALVLAAAGTLDLTGAITNHGEVDATTGQVDLENANFGGGILGGTGTIATAASNVDSTLGGVTIAGGTKVTAAVGALDLTGVITNNGEIDATTGKVHLESVTINGGTLGGTGMVATEGGADMLNGVAIAGGTTVNVTDNTTLELSGTISLSGSIALNSLGDVTQLKISGYVLLDGGGQLTLSDNINNNIVSDGSAATLANFDTITGAGTIGDSDLTLLNSGTIDATGTHVLTIDTGINTVTAAGLVGSLLVTNNAGGILEASAGHTLQIDDNVLNNGLIQAGNLGSDSVAVLNVTGSITGTGSIELFSFSNLSIGGSVSSDQTVIFSAGGEAATLILDDSKDFHGIIGGMVAGDTIDLTDVNYASSEYLLWTQTTTADGGSGVLQLYNGSGALESTLNLTGVYSQNENEFSVGKDDTGSLGTDIISNFVSFSNGTINTNGTYTPQVSNAGSTIEMTNGTYVEATSWFASTVHSISQFTASFDYTAISGNGFLDPADGMAFILQNSAAGVDALGDTGRALGYGTGDNNVAPIAPSAAIEFNLYTIYGQGTAFATDGGTGHYNSTGSVGFANGDEIQAIVSYNGSVLTETLTDLVNGATYSANYTVDLASVLGSDTAYVGFSAATGGSVSTQTISNFTFTPPPASSTVVASAPNQILSGFAAADTFVFNFAGVGNTTVTDFHPATDTLQFGSAIFASAQAALNATTDDGHGDTVIAIDGHDTITLNGVLKAQLHTTDFHIV